MGLITHRKYARKVLNLRNRPDWVALSLMSTSIATALVLPLCWTHLFEFAGGDEGNLIMACCNILVTQVLLTVLEPSVRLQIAGRLAWFARSIMWLSALAVAVPAYALQQFRNLKNRGEPALPNGLMTPDELKEFIRIHEERGWLYGQVGEELRAVLDGRTH